MGYPFLIVKDYEKTMGIFGLSNQARKKKFRNHKQIDINKNKAPIEILNLDPHERDI